MLSSMTSHNVRGAMALGEPAAPSASLFPRRTSCRWIPQSDDLHARFCNDGTVTMWRDTYGNVWLPDEKPPARWRKTMKFYRKHPDTVHLGAAAPSKAVGALQTALESLSRRVDDHRVATTLDGRMGTLTAEATNRALKLYASTAPAALRSGNLPQATIVARIAAITGYINAAHTIQAKVTSGIYRSPAAIQSFQTQLQPASYSQPASAPGGASTMPAPGYYPPSYAPPPPPGYYPPRGPGGLPQDRASLDVKAFIPAQYEHLRINPSLPMFVLIGLVGVLLWREKNRGKKKE